MKTSLSFISIAIGLLMFCSCKQTNETHSEQSYAVLTVSASTKIISETYTASIRGKQDIDIYPQVSGFITKLAVNEGERVKKGQLLFVIDQVPYQSALTTARANVASSQAAVSTAQLTYDNKKTLFENKVISAVDLQTSHNTLLSVQAQLDQAKAQELNARNNLSYTEVRSPSNGVVGSLPYRVGSLVSANLPQPLTTVSDNSDMYVYFSMSESQLLALTRKYGSKEAALKQFPKPHLQLNDRSIYPASGKVESISGVIDPSTGTVSLRAVFPNKEGLLNSGGSGNVILPIEHSNCIVIPRSATFEIQDKVYVYRIIEGKTQSSEVHVSPVNGGEEYIVNEGLSLGEIIVAEGVGLLRENTPIQVKPEEAPKK